MAASREVNFWPQIDSPERAKEWMHYGAIAAAFYAAATACVSYLAICLQRPVLGVDRWAMVEAVVFAVVAWRVHRSSVHWAVAGFLFFAASQIYSVGVAGHTNGILVSAVFFLLYLHAVRAGLYLRQAEATPVTTPAAEISAPAEALAQSHTRVLGPSGESCQVAFP